MRQGCLALWCMGLLALAGCTQSCFQKECDWMHIYERDRIPLSLEMDPSSAIAPEIPKVATPATVADPNRQPRYLSLQEAFALALENGTAGVQSIRTPGGVGDDLGSFAGRGVIGSDAVRVLALEPAIVGANIEAALARFDALWTTGMSWNANDEPTQGLSGFQTGSGARFASALAKPLPTGGVAGITFSTDYRLLSNPPGGFFSVLNPSYTPRLELAFEQPLLRGYGVDINQVLPAFPGSSLFPGLNRVTGPGEGILVTRLRFDQQRADFERAIHFLILNVEAAYWKLYGAYVSLYAAEEGLRQSHVAWNIIKSRYDLGALSKEEFSLARAQYEQFRAARMTALGNVLESERALRSLLGMTVEDGQRLIPVDTPNLTPYQPNWESALRDCLTLRPELVIAREELQARHLQLRAQKNSLLPDLRFQATHTTVGLGTRLDGDATFINAAGQPQTTNALQSLTGTHFNNWTVGLNLNVPIGYRAEHAAVRQSRLELAKSYHVLKDQERKAQTTLAKQYSQIIEKYKLIEIRRLAREAFAEQLATRSSKFVKGAKGITLEFLLDAQRAWAQALSDEYQAIVDYNIALAQFEFARGTILDYNKVVIAEGPLPYCAAVRAADHHKERTCALVLHERAHPVVYPACLTGEPGGCCLPMLPPGQAPSLAALFAGAPPVPTSLDAPPVTRQGRAWEPPVAPGLPAVVSVDSSPAPLTLPISVPTGTR